MDFPKKVTLVEVGLRDGIQNECTMITTEKKFELLKALLDSGIRVIEVGSFVRPDKVPQMAGTADLFHMIQTAEFSDDLEFRALVPNLRGLENAIKSGCKSVKLGVSASTIHNMRNYNRTPEESIAAFDAAFNLAREKGVSVIGTVQMAFGSPWEGDISIDHICSIVDIYHKYGIKKVGLGDTASMADPVKVYSLCSELNSRFPDIQFKTHFHNARGLGLSNVLAALHAGIREFDSSFAGLGGCPFVPEAAGNISTEDLLNMFNVLGIETGIDIHKVITIGNTVEQIVGHSGRSYVLQAGTIEDLMKRIAG